MDIVNYALSNKIKKYVDESVSDMNGKSAYEYAQEGGYAGTEEEFVEKLANELQLDASLKDNTKAAPAGIVGDLKNDKVDKNHGTENAGHLLYIADDGNVTMLTLGNGLTIKDGVLMLTNTTVVNAICGQAVCGEIICGGVV